MYSEMARVDEQLEMVSRYPAETNCENIVKMFQDRDGRWQLVGCEQHQQPTSERGNCAGKWGVAEQVTVCKKSQQNRWKNIEYLFFLQPSQDGADAEASCEAVGGALWGFPTA